MKVFDDVCVVIPGYGEMPHLKSVIDALESGTRIPGQIIVSHSGPGSPERYLAKCSPRVSILHSESRLFAGAARNRGAAETMARVLLFCDCDVLPAVDWVEKLVDALNQARARFVVGSVGMARTGGYWGRTNWLCEFSEQAPWRREGIQTGGASCNMAVLRVHFEQVGGFPESFRTAQDTLLFHSLRNIGLEQWFAPSATVGHFNHSGLDKMARHQWMHGKAFVQTRQRLELSGWRLVRSRWLAPLLPLAKGVRIMNRILEAPPKHWALVGLMAPGIAIGMTCWGAGMLKEVCSSRRLQCVTPADDG